MRVALSFIDEDAANKYQEMLEAREFMVEDSSSPTTLWATVTKVYCVTSNFIELINERNHNCDIDRTLLSYFEVHEK
ncbi:MAG: hypothetical protein J6S85_10390 [Methanobrevibacter sp.]|nr:hypothetical protein [Methanobrevibacter sp.]